jgi:hypothetical protein
VTLGPNLLLEPKKKPAHFSQQFPQSWQNQGGHNWGTWAIQRKHEEDARAAQEAQNNAQNGGYNQGGKLKKPHKTLIRMADIIREVN